MCEPPTYSRRIIFGKLIINSNDMSHMIKIQACLSSILQCHLYCESWCFVFSFTSSWQAFVSCWYYPKWLEINNQPEVYYSAQGHTDTHMLTPFSNGKASLIMKPPPQLLICLEGYLKRFNMGRWCNLRFWSFIWAKNDLNSSVNSTFGALQYLK